MSLPEQALATYLESAVAGFRGPVVATKFKGGQSNPTYLIEAASGKYVLRRKPSGKLLPSAHAVDREYRVLQALHGGPVPVAQPLHLCEDESVIGSVFYLMAFVPGQVHWDPSLPDMTPEQRAAHYEAIIAALAALHALDPAAIGLGDYGKPGNYFARQIHRWSEQYRASEIEPIPDMDALMAALDQRCPADDGRVALVHGDFRIDNLMFAPDEARLLAVVDWELSTLGHPLADLGYFCMALRLPRNPALPGLAGMDRAALGIPEEAAMLERYCELSGQPVPADWPFVLAFSFFRLAAIAQGVAKRAQQGNASSEQAAQAGQMTALLARLGVQALRA
ncbi:phosphotransferase [Arenimonas sp.]|uniref:phosphotransferase n=1 Tax=Arenimonas sp. TaxID=1872635 RepID=UPI0035B361DE